MKSITKVKLEDVSKMRFAATTGSGHTVYMDSMPNVGGDDSAARPAELPFVGLAGCTGMDAISILRKMKQDVQSYEVEVEGVDRTEEYPKYWKEINVVFHVTGDVDPKKLARAINLSRTRYCGVSAIMKGVVKFHYFYDLNGERVELGEPDED